MKFHLNRSSFLSILIKSLRKKELNSSLQEKFFWPSESLMTKTNHDLSEPDAWKDETQDETNRRKIWTPNSSII